MSDTPRTDASKQKSLNWTGSHTADEFESLARQLERELSAVTESNNQLILALGGFQSCIAEELGLPETPFTVDDIRPILRRLKAQHAALMEVAKAAKKLGQFTATNWDQNIFQTFLSAAKQAGVEI